VVAIVVCPLGLQFNALAELDCLDPWPAGIEGKSVRKHLREGLRRAHKLTAALWHPGLVAKLMNQLRIGKMGTAPFVLAVDSAQRVLVVCGIVAVSGVW
jgi:hypothetical protein